jgi:Fur family transcriptional regulator, stress-responsive regulator
MPPGDATTVEQLRRAGLRVTAQRCAVLEWLLEHPHATAEEVGVGVRERLRSISKQAVYDVLTTCVSAGMVRRIEPAGHPARFERRIGDNHHHLVCRWCGAIEDVDCAVGARPCLAPDADHGFAVEEAEVVFWGTCPTCRNTRGAEPDLATPELDGEHHDHRHVRDTTEV